MVTVMVLYPNDEGKDFDLDYYLKHHMPLAGKGFGNHGLKSWSVYEHSGRADGSKAPYRIEARLEFGSIDDFKAAGASEDMKEIMADIPNFTTIQPIIVIGEQKASG